MITIVLCPETRIIAFVGLVWLPWGQFVTLTTIDTLIISGTLTLEVYKVVYNMKALAI